MHFVYNTHVTVNNVVLHLVNNIVMHTLDHVVQHPVNNAFLYLVCWTILTSTAGLKPGSHFRHNHKFNDILGHREYFMVLHLIVFRNNS